MSAPDGSATLWVCPACSDELDPNGVTCLECDVLYVPAPSAATVEPALVPEDLADAVERLRQDLLNAQHWRVRSQEQYARIRAALDPLRERRDTGEPSRSDADEVEALATEVAALRAAPSTGGAESTVAVEHSDVFQLRACLARASATAGERARKEIRAAQKVVTEIIGRIHSIRPAPSTPEDGEAITLIRMVGGGAEPGPWAVADPDYPLGKDRPGFESITVPLRAATGAKKVGTQEIDVDPHFLARAVGGSRTDFIAVGCLNRRLGPALLVSGADRVPIEVVEVRVVRAGTGISSDRFRHLRDDHDPGLTEDDPVTVVRFIVQRPEDGATQGGDDG